MRIASELLDLIPRLLDRVRADFPRDTEDIAPEWRDVFELRATMGQVKLLRVLMTRQGCTMQELAEQLDVAPPTVTARNRKEKPMSDTSKASLLMPRQGACQVGSKRAGLASSRALSRCLPSPCPCRCSSLNGIGAWL
ncbi:MAG TPA: MarR family transcriptional regulator [Ktedonobacteraceae bacterium]